MTEPSLNVWYETCPICEGDCGDEFGPCVWCEGVGFIEHDPERARLPCESEDHRPPAD